MPEKHKQTRKIEFLLGDDGDLVYKPEAHAGESNFLGEDGELQESNIKEKKPRAILKLLKQIESTDLSDNPDLAILFAELQEKSMLYGCLRKIIHDQKIYLARQSLGFLSYKASRDTGSNDYLMEFIMADAVFTVVWFVIGIMIRELILQGIDVPTPTVLGFLAIPTLAFLASNLIEPTKDFHIKTSIQVLAGEQYDSYLGLDEEEMQQILQIYRKEAQDCLLLVLHECGEMCDKSSTLQVVDALGKKSVEYRLKQNKQKNEKEKHRRAIARLSKKNKSKQQEKDDERREAERLAARRNALLSKNKHRD